MRLSAVRGYDAADIAARAPGTVRFCYIDVPGTHTPAPMSADQVKALASEGIEGIVATVVPPQDEVWWDPDSVAGYLDGLAQGARDFGLPAGSPLELDVEQPQSAAIGAARGFVAHAWAMATRGHFLEPWAYSDAVYLSGDLWGHKRLAQWPEPAGSAPDPLPTEVPSGYDAWQFAGDVAGTVGRVDLDLVREGTTVTAVALSGTIEIGVTPPPPPPGPPPAVSVTVLLPLLRSGATGEEVRSLQGALNAHGATLTVDGDFGPITAEAVRRFQQDSGIGVDGIVGPVTYGALFPFRGA